MYPTPVLKKKGFDSTSVPLHNVTEATTVPAVFIVTLYVVVVVPSVVFDCLV